MQHNQYFVQRHVLSEPDDACVLTPTQIREIQRKINAHIDNVIAATLYGPYAPPIDPRTVVSEQSPRPRISIVTLASP